jgi:1,4-dihydroxy-2-naphthoate octaprenyltransferase
MNRFSVWVSELRLRTLPLAAASIILAAGLAIQAQIFDGMIFSLSLITALLLQILSNLANDYGDVVSGADNASRVGPQRAIQNGMITRLELKRAIILTIGLCCLSGLSLLVVALEDDLTCWLMFLLFGLLAVAAATSYTMGKLSYGYRALGDLSVFLFFGLLSVLGSYYLYNQSFTFSLLLPASSIGFLSMAVLNINNMRDMYTDKAAAKTTLVVLCGRKNAFIYHLFLVFCAPLLAILYLLTLDKVQPWLFVMLLILIPLAKSSLSLRNLIRNDERQGERFNEQLKNVAMTTFIFSLLFSLLLITAY